MVINTQAKTRQPQRVTTRSSDSNQSPRSRSLRTILRDETLAHDLAPLYITRAVTGLGYRLLDAGQRGSWPKNDPRWEEVFAALAQGRSALKGPSLGGLKELDHRGQAAVAVKAPALDIQPADIKWYLSMVVLDPEQTGGVRGVIPLVSPRKTVSER